MAKRNVIKLTQIDKKGNAVTDTEGNAKYDTFITPTQIPFRKRSEEPRLNSSHLSQSRMPSSA